MEYTNWILKRLLDKYYESSVYINSEGKRRVMLKPSKEDCLKEWLEKSDVKETIFNALASLKKKGLLDYSWVKFEEGNLIESIWLNTTEESISQVCDLLNVTPRKKQLEQLSQMLEDAVEQLQDDYELKSFLREQIEYIHDKHKLSRFFSDDMYENASLLRFLIAMAHNDNEQFERVLSSSLYQDSKYFERVLKGKVISILKSIRTKETTEDVSDDELLGSYGITRWPEILEFCGDVELVMQDGAKIDFSSLRWGASINSMVVPQIADVKIGCIKKVLFVENRANYFWSVQHKKENELIIYHGGFYSLIRGKWFKLLYQSCKMAENVEFYHWSDIDLGGFRIFTRLQKNIIPELQPWKMDIETLDVNKNNTSFIKNRAYLKALENLLMDKDYTIFYPVVHKMLAEKIRLEQECELS